MKKACLVLLFLMVGACLLVLAGDEEEAMNYWPMWRGPLYNGVAPHGDPPIEWSETKNVRWKVELPGPGHATPVVWGDRIYVLSAVETEKAVDPPPVPPAPATGGGSRSAHPAPSSVALASFQQERPPQGQESPAGDPPARQQRRRREPRPQPTNVHQFVVSAHDRATGVAVWKTVVREEVPHESGHTTASQASASPVTDGEHLYAFFGSRGLYCLDLEGKIKWEVDLGDMTTRNQFGEGASPAVHGDTLVVNWDHEGDSFIVSLDKRTGEERWRVARDEPTSWATPVVIEDGGRPLVVVSASNRVRAYDLKTGAEVWQCGGLGLNCIPTPVVLDDLLFVMSGYREAAGMVIRYAGAKGDITDSDAVVWRVDSGLSYVPSSLLYEGKLYFLQRFQGLLSCYDMKSGEACYGQRRLEGVENIYASLVGAKGRVYILDRGGNALVFKSGKEFEVLAQNKLDDAFDASPVIVGDNLYLRGHRYLYNLAAR